MTEHIFSYYSGGIYRTTPTKEININEALDLIRSKKFQKKIARIRESTDKKIQNQLKEQLDYFTFAGTFDKRANDKLKEASGLICLDIDDIEKDRRVSIKEKLKEDKYTFCMFASTRGGGFKLLIKIPQVKDDSEYKIYWNAVSKHYNLPENNDIHTKDISRACYVSYDPDLYHNPDSELFTIARNNILTSPEKEDITQLKLLQQSQSNDSALDILTKYKIDIKDKWLYDLLLNKVIVRENTGGNSIVLKTAMIICLRENMLDDEIRTIGKSLADLCEGRTYQAFMGWKKNKLIGEVNETEINNFILDNKYPLSVYSSEGKMIKNEVKVKDHKYFSDFRKNPDNRQTFIVQKLTPSKSLTLVYGGPKSSKSLFELTKCFCISRGIKFLDKFRTKKSNCLYIDRENNEYILSERELAVKKFLKKRKHGVHFITRESHVDILSSKFFMTLIDIIKKYEIKYIVFDTLPKCAVYQAKEEEEINKIYLNFFSPLIEEYGVTMTFILHTTKKGDSFIGSQAYKGIVDCCYEFNKESNSTIGNQSIIKTSICSDNRQGNNNFGVEWTFDVEEDKQGDEHLKNIKAQYFETEGNRLAGQKKNNQQTYDKKKLTQDIIRVFDENDVLHKSEVVERMKLSGYTDEQLLSLDSSIKRTLTWLCDKANILKKGGKGRGTSYSLSEKGVNMLHKRESNQTLNDEKK